MAGNKSRISEEIKDETEDNDEIDSEVPLGIGLMICKRIISDNDGEIKVKQSNHSTTIMFTMSMKEPDSSG